MMIVFAGDPNTPGAGVGGALNYLCYDTVNSELFICTTAGSATGTPAPQAVWTGIVSAGAFMLL